MSPRLRFDVIDTGIGMTEEQIGRLFQPFSQVDNSTTRKFGGTGLGLSISKRLAEALGGNINVRPQPGKGSTFSVTIDPGPLDGVQHWSTNPTEAQSPQLPETSQPTPMPDSHSADPAGRRWAGQSAVDRLAAQESRRRGHGGRERAARRRRRPRPAQDAGEPFDVILMDMQMPVHGRLRGDAATARAHGYAGPIIALTAHAMARDREKCLDAGCDDYLTKPIDHTEVDFCGGQIRLSTETPKRQRRLGRSRQRKPTTADAPSRQPARHLTRQSPQALAYVHQRPAVVIGGLPDRALGLSGRGHAFGRDGVVPLTVVGSTW